MTMIASQWLRRFSAAWFSLFLVSAQSNALARGSGLPHEEPWDRAHIDHLPTEVRSVVLRMCRMRPDAAHYFATYYDHARLIKLNFGDFYCDGRPIYREGSLCLHEEFTLLGARYQQTRSYYTGCDD
jgi:hypothetical protein